MTEQEKKILWEALHECYSIADVIAHSCNYYASQPDPEISISSYATLLERSTTLLGKAIAIVDNLPDKSKSDKTKNIAFVDSGK